MKRILGLDLGTTSIGWALVNDKETDKENSSIVKLGVRVVPLSTDEQSNFEKGKSITTNADRTLKRSMRRNLQRYRLRRENLIECLKENGFITDDTLLSEDGNRSTFQTYRLRARAVTEEVSLQELARVLLMINKKRGYKSSRKCKSAEEGQLIDGMSIAKTLAEENITPGQYVYRLLEKGKKYIPDFYRSDLKSEFARVFDTQKTFHPDIFTDELREAITGKSKTLTTKIILAITKTYTAENKGKDKRLQAYKWRSEAVQNRLTSEEAAYVLADINGNIDSSSGYLGSISDRSKELFFGHLTVGQYLIRSLDADPHFSLKNKVFYRQDYLDEFEAIWACQSQFHPELTDALKKEIRDIIIFYQRRLKSQKGLLDICELESRQIEIETDGIKRKKTIGPRVCPKSSPIFQEFKIWQRLNDLRIIDDANASRSLTEDEKSTLFAELDTKGKMSQADALKLLFGKKCPFKLSHKEIDGNTTKATIIRACQDIIAMSGHGEYDFSKMPAEDILHTITTIFNGLGFNTDFLTFNSNLEGKALTLQPAYHFWHLIYSYEGDNSNTGNETLIKNLQSLCNIDREYAAVFANITFPNDYGNLSAKAISKILPFMKDGNDYTLACVYAGYNHSKRSLTREENEKRILADHLDLLPRNSLRNPVVEKILNQMINVVNTILKTYGPLDEIRIELARELKKNAHERELLTNAINKATLETAEYTKILQSEFGLVHVSHNDIVRYRLYLELKPNGFHTPYSNTYIPKEELFSKKFDIEHIIPKARLFDDSFSNKTLEARDINIEKKDKTAMDYILDKYEKDGEAEYRNRINHLLESGSISKQKHAKLLMSGADIPDGFIDRDLRETQYIARKAKEILEQIVRTVMATTGSVTDRLREDWQLVDVLKELNWNKYDSLGLTYNYNDKDGRTITAIKNWTKRNDHRHHAMDALTIAFTKQSFIQYLNNLNARSDKAGSIYGIEQKELYRDSHGRLRFLPPMPLADFRTEAKHQLEDILVSIKAKNKVMTKNVNRTSRKEGTFDKTQLTPRGQLHNETIYGSSQRPVTREVKVGSDFTEEMIQKVASPKQRAALLRRLREFDGNPKKAFTGKNSLEKNPLYTDDMQLQQVPTKVKIVEFETVYSIRKPIDKTLKLDKVLDAGIRAILQKRLDEYGGDANKAFSNLDENPIWLNKEKGISIKRVAISGIANGTPLHDKRDKEGKKMHDANGKTIPNDFVNTSNNHHAAIFRDEKGNLQEHIVSFLEATTLMSQGLTPIDKNYHSELGWQFLFTLKQNEYFVFPNSETGFNPKDVDLKDSELQSEISQNLYRVRSFSTKDYFFMHHLETTINDDNALKNKTWFRFKSLPFMEDIVKVRINHLGQIVEVGEY